MITVGLCLHIRGKSFHCSSRFQCSVIFDHLALQAQRSKLWRRGMSLFKLFMFFRVMVMLIAEKVLAAKNKKACYRMLLFMAMVMTYPGVVEDHAGNDVDDDGRDSAPAAALHFIIRCCCCCCCCSCCRCCCCCCCCDADVLQTMMVAVYGVVEQSVLAMWRFRIRFFDNLKVTRAQSPKPNPKPPKPYTLNPIKP